MLLLIYCLLDTEIFQFTQTQTLYRSLEALVCSTAPSRDISDPTEQICEDTIHGAL